MEREKVKKILLFLIVCLSVFCLVGCAKKDAEKDENYQFIYYTNGNMTFVEVVGFSSDYGKAPFSVVVHKETKVMYIRTKEYLHGGIGGICVMLDENGKPLLWEGEL